MKNPSTDGTGTEVWDRLEEYFPWICPGGAREDATQPLVFCFFGRATWREPRLRWDRHQRRRRRRRKRWGPFRSHEHRVWRRCDGWWIVTTTHTSQYLGSPSCRLLDHCRFKQTLWKNLQHKLIAELLYEYIDKTIMVPEWLGRFGEGDVPVQLVAHMLKYKKLYYAKKSHFDGKWNEEFWIACSQGSSTLRTLCGIGSGTSWANSPEL